MPYKSPTTLQRKVAKKVSEAISKGQNVSMRKVMVEEGYTPVSARASTQLTNSPNFKQALKDYGLTEELIKSALTDDIKAKVGNRAQELKLGAEILKLKTNDTNINIGVSLSSLFEESIKQVDNLANDDTNEPKQLT